MIFHRPGLLVFVFLTTAFLRGQSTVPTLSRAIPDQTIAAGGQGVAIELKDYFTVPGLIGTQFAQFNTVLGKFNVELRDDAAPRHVANFLAYVQGGDYSNTFFHRAASFESAAVSIIQAGGYRIPLGPSDIPKRAPVALEYNLPNARGTLAAARTTDINSATSEWYLNVRDNSTILNQSNGGGYSVFGRVMGTGMSVVDAIAAVPRYNAGVPFTELPLRNVAANATTITESNLIVVSSVSKVSLFPTGEGGSIVEFSVQNSNPSAIVAVATGTRLTLTPIASGRTTVTVRATDVNGNSATGAFDVTVQAAGSIPVISTNPVSQSVAPGSTVVFTAAASSASTTTYQWLRNGANIDGATSATLVLSGTSGATAALAGAYAVVVTNASGNATSASATLNVASATDPGRLGNLSILTSLGAGETMTMGTVLGGGGTTGTKSLLARAAGPSLAQLGVTGFLPDPTMTLVNTTASPGTTVAINNDWNGTTTLSNAFTQVGAFAYVAANSKDAALFQSGGSALAPGNYTVQVSDAGTGTGTVIAELYDATPTGAVTAATPRLINVSVLKTIGTGDSLTAGFYVGGTTAKTVLIRAIGPALGLAPFNISGAMPDPQLTLFNSSQQVIATNNDWGGDQQLTDTGSRVGAFAVANRSSKDAMLLITLAPGASYTAQVSPAGAGGTAIVEVYEVP